MINILVCDDEKHSTQQTTEYLQQLAAGLSLEITVETVSSGEELLTAYQQKSSSLIILDIEMDGLDGLEAAKSLNEELSYTGPIVFLTNHERQLLTSQERGHGYLLEKPVDYPVFVQLLEPILKRLAQDRQRFYFQTVEEEEHSLLAKDILFVQSKRFLREQGVLLKTQEQEYVLADSIDQIQQQLAGDSFYRINQQLLVNLDKVLMLENHYLQLTGDIKVKLHRRDKKAVQEQLFQLV